MWLYLKYKNIVELGYNDVGLCDTSSVMSYILSDQVILTVNHSVITLLL